MSDDESTIDFVTAFARLLSSQVLREQFRESPSSVSDQLGINQQDRSAFESLCADQVEQQAETLLNKRWHEVRRLAPKTTASLGEDGAEIFRYFASNDWPEGHRRHVVDAYRFLKFLRANGIQKPDRVELNRVRLHQ